MLYLAAVSIATAAALGTGLYSLSKPTNENNKNKKNNKFIWNSSKGTYVRAENIKAKKNTRKYLRNSEINRERKRAHVPGDGLVSCYTINQELKQNRWANHAGAELKHICPLPYCKYEPAGIFSKPRCRPTANGSYLSPHGRYPLPFARQGFRGKRMT